MQNLIVVLRVLDIIFGVIFSYHPFDIMVWDRGVGSGA